MVGKEYSLPGLLCPAVDTPMFRVSHSGPWGFVVLGIGHRPGLLSESLNHLLDPKAWHFDQVRQPLWVSWFLVSWPDVVNRIIGL